MTATEQHEVGAPGCQLDQHCATHHVDEPGPAFLICGECWHGYPSRRALRRAYRKTMAACYRRDWQRAPWLKLDPLWRDSKLTIAYTLAGVYFRRTSHIYSCPECGHDF